VNFDLTEDQEALRDGIRALCVGRFGMERVRVGFDRSMSDELAETGVFSLRSDGFTWSDASIAFQELGRALVPGPLVWSHLAHGVVEGIVTGVERPTDATPTMVEHLAEADAVVVIDASGVSAIPSAAFDGAVELEWPLDPLTPVHRVGVLPEAERIGDARLAAQWGTGGAVLTAAYQVGMAEACVAAATAYSL